MRTIVYRTGRGDSEGLVLRDYHIAYRINDSEKEFRGYSSGLDDEFSPGRRDRPRPPRPHRS